jgi:hypothetical protein
MTFSGIKCLVGAPEQSQQLVVLVIKIQPEGALLSCMLKSGLLPFLRKISAPPTLERQSPVLPTCEVLQREVISPKMGMLL